MTQKQLNQAVARITGESLSTIRRMGFSPLTELSAEDYDCEPLVVDWDALDAAKRSSIDFPASAAA